MTATTSTVTSRREEQLEFLSTYWNALNAGDMATFAPLVHEDCVVHYPGNHFLSGDHRGRGPIVDLYTKLYRIGIEPGTFVGEFHDAVTSDDHCCALIKYRLELGAGQRLTGEAVGVFHLEDGQMREYWLFERDQKMINDIINLSGKATLAGGGMKEMAVGALKHPLALVRTARRVVRQRRGTNTKML
jgi:ketosteroid isomerase-like protein